MNTIYWLIPVQGERTKFNADLPAHPTFAELKGLIQPHFAEHFERVNVLTDHGYSDMFVDDDRHRKGLERNDAATIIYRHNWLTHHPMDAAETLPHIVGPAVLFSRRVWF